MRDRHDGRDDLARHEIRVSRLVHLPSERLWEVVARFMEWTEWHPRGGRTERVGERASGLGAVRRIHMAGGVVMTEPIVEWVEGEQLAFDFVGGPRWAPFGEGYVRVSLRPQGDRTVVTFAGGFVAPWGLLGRVLRAAVMPRLLERLWGEVITHLAHYAATGQRLAGQRPAVLVRNLRSREELPAGAGPVHGAPPERDL